MGVFKKELKKIETIWHGFHRKMIANGFKRKNVPLAYLKEKRSNPDTPEPDDLDWYYVFTNNQLEQISKTLSILIFCKKPTPKIHCSCHEITKRFAAEADTFFIRPQSIVIAG